MKWLLPLIALCLGLLGGWFFAGSSDTDGSERFKSSSANESSVASGTRLSSQGALDVSELTPAQTVAMESTEMTSEWLESLEDMDELDQLSALLERLKRAKSSDFSSLMDVVQQYQGTMRWTAMGILATKWANADPQGMIAYIESQPTDKQWGLRSAFYGAWAKKNPQAAYNAAMNESNQRAQQSALQVVIQAIAHDDPQSAIEMAQQMEDLGHRSDWVMRGIYQNWAHTDLESARNSALALPDGPQKVQALSGALGHWMQESPFAALDWLESLPVDGTVYNSKKEVFRRLLNQDIDTAKAYIEGKTDPMDRREILQNVSFGNLAWKSDFEEIQEIYTWVGEVATGQVYDHKVGEIMRELVQVDRARAEAFVLDLPAGNARMNAISSLAQKIAERDPAAGIEFATSLTYEDEKQRALSNMGWQISRYGIEAVKPLIAQSEDPDVQRQLASRIVSEWSKYDQSGALAWAESLGDDQARSSAIQSVYQNWMQAEPGAALNYLQTSVEEGKQMNYLRSGFQEWARQDPEAAVGWLDQIPDDLDEKGGSDIYRSVARTYVQHDPMAASEWISTLDEGPNRDRSVETLVQSISKTDPEAGFIWASTVGDESMRKNTLTQSLRSWVKTDPDAAFEAVKDAKIEASEKESLFELIKNAR